MTRGEVALIDGDTKKIINIVKTGYAVHISRLSASGRYLYVIGRDAKINLIDLWMEKPDNVAEIKVGLEARSVETSKYKGYEDKYAIAGSYWPPQYVIMKGDTLEPLKIVAHARHDRGHAGVPSGAARGLDRRFALQARVRGERQGNRQDPDGQLHGHQQPDRPPRSAPRASCTTAAGTRASATSWWPPTSRNKIAVVDAKDGKLVAARRRRQDPAPGTRRQLRASEVRAGLGHGPPGQREDRADRHRPGEEQAARLEGRARCSTARAAATSSSRRHPKSTNLYVDTPLHPDPKVSKSVAVFNIKDLKAGFKVLPIFEWSGIKGEAAGRVVQPEFNKAGDEVWFAVWSAKNQESALVVVDDKTLKLKAVIRDPKLITPTGHFNVYNTQHDIY